MTETQQYDQSIIKIKIGNRTYDVPRSKHCPVCMHPGRYAIEERMLLNYSYPSIVKWISGSEITLPDGSTEPWPEVSAHSLRSHRNKGHVPMDTQLFNALVEQRAEAEGIDLETYTGRFVDEVVANQIVLSRGVERILKGEIEPDVKDVLTASKLMGDLRAAAGQGQGTSEEEFMEVMRVYFTAVQNTVSEDQWLEIVNTISRNPVVVAMQEKMNSRKAIEK